MALTVTHIDGTDVTVWGFSVSAVWGERRMCGKLLLHSWGRVRACSSTWKHYFLVTCSTSSAYKKVTKSSIPFGCFIYISNILFLHVKKEKKKLAQLQLTTQNDDQRCLSPPPCIPDVQKTLCRPAKDSFSYRNFQQPQVLILLLHQQLLGRLCFQLPLEGALCLSFYNWKIDDSKKIKIPYSLI